MLSTAKLVAVSTLGGAGGDPRCDSSTTQTGPSAATPALGAVGDDGAPGRGSRQPLIALALLAPVIGLDQTTKWRAWRHASVAYMNAGSTWLIGQPVSGWKERRCRIDTRGSTM